MISKRDQFRKCFKRAQSLLLQEVINEVDKELRKKERIWVRNYISERDQKGGSVMLLQQLKVEDPNEYRLALRMTAENFEELLSLVSINIQRNNKLFGDAIPAKIKLEVTLSFLTTGDSYSSLSRMFRLPKPTISKIIPEVCQEIKRVLKDHIKIPTAEQWKQVEEGFQNKWNFPLYYGALDGKHIKITGSYEYESTNFNYKKENSIVLMALVDHDYCFTYINVGANGSASDGGIFYMTPTCVDHEDHNDHHLINGTWRSGITSLDSIIQQGSNNSATHAREKRIQFTNYFVNEGKVPWQNHMIP